MGGDELAGAAVVIAVVLFVILVLVWQINRSRSLLEQWAAENNYRILAAQQRFLVRGPFFWTTSKGQTVYRITVQDPSGAQRTGWLRCGSWPLGLLSDRVQAKWDDGGD